MKHADDGYSRRGNYGGSLVRNMVLIYSPDGTDVYGSRGGRLRGCGRCRGLKVLRGRFLFTCSDTFAVGCIV